MGKTWKDKNRHDRSYYEGSFDKKRKNKDLQRDLNLRNNKKTKRSGFNDRDSEEE